MRLVHQQGPQRLVAAPLLHRLLRQEAMWSPAHVQPANRGHLAALLWAQGFDPNVHRLGAHWLAGLQLLAFPRRLLTQDAPLAVIVIETRYSCKVGVRRSTVAGLLQLLSALADSASLPGLLAAHVTQAHAL